jgi:hypothetical protein
MIEETKTEIDAYINIVQSPWNSKFTIALNNFDVQEGKKGYSAKDVQELIGLLERGVYHLKNCTEDYKKENDGKEIKERECRGCTETIGRID